MRTINNTLQKSIIVSWILAWLLITAMPVIHANSTNSLQQPSHCPVASMDMFSEQSMTHTSKTEATETKKFYHCPLCHCASLIFANFPVLVVRHHLYFLPLTNTLHFFSSPALFFKQPRSPPASL